MRLRKRFGVLKNSKADILASSLDFRLVIHGNTRYRLLVFCPFLVIIITDH